MYVKYDARHYVESPIRSGERLSYTSLHIVTHRYTSLDPIGPFERRTEKCYDVSPPFKLVPFATKARVGNRGEAGCGCGAFVRTRRPHAAPRNRLALK